MYSETELQKKWLSTFEDFQINENQSLVLFHKIIKCYQESGRFYHNLSHISALLKFGDAHAEKISDRFCFEMAIWFHDTVYNIFKKNNEEKSAEFAKNELLTLGIPSEKIDKIYKMIVATQSHQTELTDFDTLFFLDCDLSILASEPVDYQEYCRNIRKEYRWIPWLLYRKGRTKVLAHFLAKPKVFKTEIFAEKEALARKNIKSEIILLKNRIN